MRFENDQIFMFLTNVFACRRNGSLLTDSLRQLSKNTDSRIAIVFLFFICGVHSRLIVLDLVLELHHY